MLGGVVVIAVSRLLTVTVPTHTWAWECLLPDFGKIIQDNRQEEEKDRRKWSNQASLYFLILLNISAQTLSRVGIRLLGLISLADVHLVDSYQSNPVILLYNGTAQLFTHLPYLLITRFVFPFLFLLTPKLAPYHEPNIYPV